MSVLRYLLDTNTISAAMRDPFGRAATEILKRGIDRSCTSIVVASELRFGAALARSKQLTERVDQILSTTTVLPFESPADSVYADTRAALVAAGTPIGANDLFIAAHALALDLTLVTANADEFSRVPGLRVENWLD